jgi:site-specific DNA-cytosine methylase
LDRLVENFDKEKEEIKEEMKVEEEMKFEILEEEKNVKGEVDDIIWTLSPPCQPYSRQGKFSDLSDNRANSLINLFTIFPKLKYKPHYILIENVKNFEVSIQFTSLFSLYRFQKLLNL